jgi:hypothetical protein
MIRFTRARHTVIGTRMVHKIDAQTFFEKKSLRVIWCYS